MKPARFELHRPASVSEAVAALAAYPDAKVIAGGQSLAPMMMLRLATPAHLVDLGRIAELDGVGVDDTGYVRIGAMTRQAAFERDPRARAAVPLIAAATRHIGHFQIRNRGTVGGSLAHADPAAELPAVALALCARLRLAGPDGERVVDVGDFFVDVWSTALGDDEVLVSIDVPVAVGGGAYGVGEIARRHGDFAICGAAVALTLGGERTIEHATVALFGVADTPVRALETEHLLVGRRVDDLRGAAAAAVAELTPRSDIHASAAYRLDVVPVVVRRAIEDALSRYTEGDAE